MSILSPRFDISTLPYFDATGFLADDAPAYEPTAEDMAYCLGYETTQAGEAAKLGTLGGYSAAEHLAFCRGQRAAREAMREVPAIPTPMTPDDLAEALGTMAAWCAGQGGQLGAMAAHLLRQGGKDVAYYRAATPEEFDARENEMIESLQDCPECRRSAYVDRM